VGRAPVRFIVMALFFWMIVAAYGLQWLNDVILTRYGPCLVAILMALIFLWTAAEIYSPTPAQLPYEIPPQITQIVHGPVIELPLRFHDGWGLLLQTFHHQPLATGEVSRNSALQQAHFETLRNYYAEALQSGSCQRFIEMGFRNIIIHGNVPDDVVQGLTHSSQCPINIVDLR
jgi:hypothetical protein